MITLASTEKHYTLDQDKQCSPEETIQRVTKRLRDLSLNILAETKRIDHGVLGIPVYISRCGADARRIMPTTKQMGKGATPMQAEASALMELMERYGYFSYWQNLPDTTRASWTEAEELFPNTLIPLNAINKACSDTLALDDLWALLNARKWIFAPAVHIATGKITHVPIELFKILNEFNGSSAGNSDVEAILQGCCELIERHVCAVITKEQPILPTIDSDPDSVSHPVLKKLLQSFHDNNITLVLKDFSMNMPVPTVAAIAMNPATFPATSEIVYTAGTACTPEVAAIRALTEVAQLAGDFCTSACYEASGLPKFRTWDEAAWLLQGNVISLESLPAIRNEDMLIELQTLALQLAQAGYDLYSISTTNPETLVPSTYNFVPGFQFRERDEAPSLGLFLSRLIIDDREKEYDLDDLFLVMEDIYPNAHFIPFYQGLTALYQQNYQLAYSFFAKALPLQPHATSRALTNFYYAYTLAQEARWKEAISFLDEALKNDPDLQAALNLRGACYYNLEEYAQAIPSFTEIISRLDKGSIIDLHNLGLCYKKLGKNEKALHFFTAILESDPENQDAKKQIQSIEQES